jgi:C-terminal processing protease CtpA/Prc
MHYLKKGLVAAFISGLLFTSCKKEVDDNTTDPPATDTIASKADLEKDTTLGYAKDIYLWYKQIPASFDARSYKDPDAIMEAIRRYSIEPGFTDPVDRWSFAMKKEEWNKVSSGIAGDFGLGVFFRSETDLRVKLVEAASPAGLAGIRRGWRIAKINGSSNISTSNTGPVVEAVFNSNKTTFTFEKPDGTTTDISLNTATYQENPIVLDTVYTTGGKKIGYFVFNSFLGDTSKINNSFQTIFADFDAQGVGDVVVDLRYNGGGYVSVQKKLANYLAPLSANGKLMMKEEFNDKHTLWNDAALFRKLGSFQPSRIFFIVSKSTASASELLINNLKPYVDVMLVGPSKTYGKPVGFFAIPVGDWYTFPVSFRSTNADGEGAYFDGIALNKQTADGLDKDWGDVTESCLASVISYITTGAFLGAPGPASFAEKADVVRGNTVLAKPDFKGAIDVRGLK